MLIFADDEGDDRQFLVSDRRAHKDIERVYVRKAH